MEMVKANHFPTEVNKTGQLLKPDTLSLQEFLPLLRQASKTGSSKPIGCSRAAILNMSTKVASFDDNRSARIYSYRCSKVKRCI